MEKLEILSDAAKYDAACTSSGSSRSTPAERSTGYEKGKFRGSLHRSGPQGKQ